MQMERGIDNENIERGTRITSMVREMRESDCEREIDEERVSTREVTDMERQNDARAQHETYGEVRVCFWIMGENITPMLERGTLVSNII
jgi:hypothetical protein